jgi:hypothetical protein
MSIHDLRDHWNRGRSARWPIAKVPIIPVIDWGSGYLLAKTLLRKIGVRQPPAKTLMNKYRVCTWVPVSCGCGWGWVYEYYAHLWLTHPVFDIKDYFSMSYSYIFLEVFLWATVLNPSIDQNQTNLWRNRLNERYSHLQKSCISSPKQSLLDEDTTYIKNLFTRCLSV